MKLRSKIAVSAALLGAITTVQAESITFGVEIAPVATLIVRDGMLKNATSMYKATVDATAAANTEVVGGFTVVTNMPKWNIYFGFANGGALKNQAGRQITDEDGLALFLGSTNSAVAAATTEAAVYLTSADAVKAEDTSGDDLLTLALAAATAPIVNNTSNNTLTKAIADVSGACTGPVACVFGTPWLTATDMTTANFDIRTGVEGAGTSTNLASVAGTYTETLYLTLVTTY